MSHTSNPNVRFVGNWLSGERQVAEGAVRAAEEFLESEMPRPWVFVKGSKSYSLTQNALFRTEKTAPTLPQLIEEIHRGAAAAFAVAGSKVSLI